MRKQAHQQYAGHRTPGVRLMEPILPEIRDASKDAHIPQLYAYHMFDKAHLVMLAEGGLIPRADVVTMLRALAEMEAEGVQKVREEVGGGMYSGEHYLIRRLGEQIGGRIHLGRSAGDLEAVARRVRQRQRLIGLMEGINRLRETTLTVAEQNLDAVMPGYTHSQHAQPITLGHQLLAWASCLERDFQRAEGAYSRVNQSPAGAAIMTGSDFPLDRHRTAELLGFDGVLKNTFDAIMDLDFELDSFFAVSVVHLNLSKWASDINFWYTSESGYIDIPDRFCGTSSIMMQKKNPDLLEYIRGAVSLSMGGLVTAFSVQKACTGEPTLDPRYMDQTLFQSFDLADRHLKWMTELLPAIMVKKERMSEMAGRHWAQATDVAGALVREKGLPWRTAHQIVGILVRLSVERGVRPGDATTQLVDEAAVQYMGEPVGLSEDALRKALDPKEFVKGRTLYGGPAPAECARRIVEYRDQLRRDEESLDARKRRLKEAAGKLELAVSSFIGTRAMEEE